MTPEPPSRLERAARSAEALLSRFEGVADPASEAVLVLRELRGALAERDVAAVAA